MTEKPSSSQKMSPKELASQLRKPIGKKGKEIGLEMNKGNKHISLNSYQELNIEKGNQILEIGMGNGFFVKDLLQKSEDINYTGVDFSEIMIQEAKRLNQEFINQGLAQFKMGSLENLPFDDNSFDRISTTNTIYFWPHPEANTKELFRVLKPSGKILLAYRPKTFINQIEFSKYGFKKYDNLQVEKLLENAGFKKVSTKTIAEPELIFDEKTLKMEGVFTTGYK